MIVCGLEAVERVPRVRGTSGFRISRLPGPGSRLVHTKNVDCVGQATRIGLWLGFAATRQMSRRHADCQIRQATKISTTERSASFLFSFGRVLIFSRICWRKMEREEVGNANLAERELESLMERD